MCLFSFKSDSLFSNLSGHSDGRSTICSLGISSAIGSLGNLTLKTRPTSPNSMREKFVSKCLNGRLDGASFYRTVKDVIVIAGHSNEKVDSVLIINSVTQHVQGQQYGVIDDSSANTFDRTGVVGLANSGNPDTFGSEVQVKFFQLFLHHE